MVSNPKNKVKTQSNVEKIDLSNKTLIVNNGQSIQFDKLVIASGAIPRELPTTAGMGNSFTLRQPQMQTLFDRQQITQIVLS